MCASIFIPFPRCRCFQVEFHDDKQTKSSGDGEMDKLMSLKKQLELAEQLKREQKCSDVISRWSRILETLMIVVILQLI